MERPVDRLAAWLTSLLDVAAWLLPPGRRQWIEAVQAEAGQVPAGRQRLNWIAGGLWLAVKEANVARKVGYWLGVGAVAVFAGWVAWLSFWDTAPTDAEAVTDRFRIVVLLMALVGLPWLARRRGLFGPVGPSVIARFVRVAGSAALCLVGFIVLRIDAHAQGNIMGNGRFNPVEEFCGLAALAVAVLAPFVIKARWPQAGREIPWCVVACGVATALPLIPLQIIPIGYLVLILAATAQRSPVRPRTLTVAVIAAMADGLISTGMRGFPDSPFLFIASSLTAVLLCTAAAGAAAAWLMDGAGSDDQTRAARIRQGMYAGIVAGAIGGLLCTFTFLFFVYLIVAGPLIGALGGQVGAALAADNLRKRPRSDRSISVGLFVSD